MHVRKYLLEAARLGFRVLDVYRFKDKEILRGLYRGKVVLVELPKLREYMDLETFRKELQSRLAS